MNARNIATKDADYGWEKEHAPRISKAQLSLAIIVYGAWIAFLATLSVQRWFGGLQ